MPFMVGRNPIIRTRGYLEAGMVYLNERIKIFSLHTIIGAEHCKGMNEFVIFNLPQIQYKNPDVQCLVYRNIMPTPFIRCFLESEEEVLVDCDSKERKDILKHVISILGKPEHKIKQELLSKQKKENPANFGYMCEKHCICEITGQVPCPAVIPVPLHFRGKYLRELTLKHKSGVA